MGGSRSNEHDRNRVARQITDPDAVIGDLERARCVQSVTAWNLLIEAWHTTEPSPSLGTALVARHHYLKVLCRACRQVSFIDLRSLNQHPLTPLTSIVGRLRCYSRCDGAGPPTALGLTSTPPETALEYWMRVKSDFR